jgi:hypothetical protein
MVDHLSDSQTYSCNNSEYDRRYGGDGGDGSNGGDRSDGEGGDEGDDYDDDGADSRKEQGLMSTSCPDSSFFTLCLYVDENIGVGP